MAARGHYWWSDCSWERSQWPKHTGKQVCMILKGIRMTNLQWPGRPFHLQEGRSYHRFHQKSYESLLFCAFTKLWTWQNLRFQRFEIMAPLRWGIGGKNVTLRRRDKDLMITETITWYGDHIMEMITWRKMPSFPHWQWRLLEIKPSDVSQE